MRFGDREEIDLYRPKKPNHFLQPSSSSSANKMELISRNHSHDTTAHESVSTEESYLTTPESYSPPAAVRPPLVANDRARMREQRTTTPMMQASSSKAKVTRRLPTSPSPSPPVPTSNSILPAVLPPREINVPCSSQDDDDLVSCITFHHHVGDDGATIVQQEQEEAYPTRTPTEQGSSTKRQQGLAQRQRRYDTRNETSHQYHYQKELDQSLETVKKQITASTRLVLFKDKQIHQIHEKMGHVDSQRQTAQQQLEDSQCQLDTLQEQVTMNKKEMQQIFAQIVQLYDAIQQKTRITNQVEKQCTELKQDVSKHMEELQQLERSRDTLLAQREACQEEKIAAERTMANSQNELESLLLIQKLDVTQAEI